MLSALGKGILARIHGPNRPWCRAGREPSLSLELAQSIGGAAGAIYKEEHVQLFPVRLTYCESTEPNNLRPFTPDPVGIGSHLPKLVFWVKTYNWLDGNSQ